MIRFILHETRMRAASRPMTPAIRTCLLDNDAEREEIVAAWAATMDQSARIASFFQATAAGCPCYRAGYNRYDLFLLYRAQPGT